MAEKLIEVYNQYQIEVTSSRRGRGATVLNTPQECFVLEPFKGSVSRLEQEHVLKGLLLKEGFLDIDEIIPNKEGELLSYDRYHQPFVLKRYYTGEECDMRNSSDVERAVGKLAEFHVYGKEVATYFQKEWENVKREKEQLQLNEMKEILEEGEDLEQVARLYGMAPSVLRELMKEEGERGKIEKECEIRKNDADNNKKEINDGLKTLIRRNTELQKIRKYIGTVKRKNSFENLFLHVFPEYYAKGIQCVEIFRDVMNVMGFIDKTDANKEQNDTDNVWKRHYGICHGNFNQHNIIMRESNEAIVHFERFSLGNQLLDLYQFARKVMEKNHFDYELLEMILETYARHIHLVKEDYSFIYVLFSYPEKFWKIANGYYNSNKAFLSPKYTEKLQTVIEQEREKNAMLEEYSAFHLQGN